MDATERSGMQFHIFVPCFTNQENTQGWIKIGDQKFFSILIVPKILVEDFMGVQKVVHCTLAQKLFSQKCRLVKVWRVPGQKTQFILSVEHKNCKKFCLASERKGRILKCEYCEDNLPCVIPMDEEQGAPGSWIENSCAAGGSVGRYPWRSRAGGAGGGGCIERSPAAGLTFVWPPNQQQQRPHRSPASQQYPRNSN